MTANLLLLGALLAAPLLAQKVNSADPQLRNGQLVWFELTESRADVVKRLGTPVSVADFGEDFQAWQYHIGNGDHHDFSHYLVFRRSTDKLVSITRVYESETNVEPFFPAAVTSGYHLDDSQPKGFGARVRKLDGKRILIAIGSAEPGKPTNQLMLISESEVSHFHKWLHTRMSAASDGGS